jgi:hypothetical protein
MSFVRRWLLFWAAMIRLVRQWSAGFVVRRRATVVGDNRLGRHRMVRHRGYFA